MIEFSLNNYINNYVMEAIVSTSFVYAVLGGLFVTLSFIYYMRRKDPLYQRHPMYHATIFFVIANIIFYFVKSDNKSDTMPQIKMKSLFTPQVTEMKTGYPNF